MTMPPLPEPLGVIVVGTQARRAFTAEQMVDYAAAVRAATIEECAKVCDGLSEKWPIADNHFDMCAAAIRALKDKP